MKADTDQRGGPMGRMAGRLGKAGPAVGASIVRSRLFLKYAAAVRRRGLRRAGHQRRVRDLVVLSRTQGRAHPIQREQAESAAAKIGQFIKEIESQVGWTTQLLWSAGTIEQRRFDALRLLRQVPAITELAQLDATGQEQLRVSRLAMDVVGSGIDLSKEPKFTEAVKHKVYYGPVYFRRESEPYMTLSLAGTRRDAGVSIAEVNLKLIWDVVSKIKVGKHGRRLRGRPAGPPDRASRHQPGLAQNRYVAAGASAGARGNDAAAGEDVQEPRPISRAGSADRLCAGRAARLDGLRRAAGGGGL